MRRRDFISKTAIGTAGFTLAGKTLSAMTTSAEKTRQFAVFTKCLQFLKYDELGEVLAWAGFDGADVPVRPGGQVLPESVKSDLPALVKSLKKAKVGVPMITTAITDPADPDLEKILQVASQQGIKYYRMGWIPYDDKKSIPQNLDEMRRSFEQFEKINRKYQIRGEYQNHAGRRLGGPVWDVYHVLKDIDPQFIGVQYDVRHATVEGGNSWLLGMRLVAPWIGTTDIKDFVWEKDPKGMWRAKTVPLGEGMVDFGTYFREYQKLNITDPVSIHYEYDLGGAEQGSKNPTMPLAEIKKWLKKDLIWLKDQFTKYQL
jgi:L-ribulose-5-phosphate 3-epimerase